MGVPILVVYHVETEKPLLNEETANNVKKVDVQQLVSLRETQLLYKLSDELAEESFRTHTRKIVEEKISTALNILKSRARATVFSKTLKNNQNAAGNTCFKETSPVIEELNKILSFNDLLISLQNHPDASRFALGVGPVSVVGGDFDSDMKMDDLKLLFRSYVTDALSGSRMEENKLAALNQLRNISGLGKREAELVMLDVTSKVYHKRLSQAVSGGPLEGAQSKAEFLQNLCNELRFHPEKAIEIHEGKMIGRGDTCLLTRCRRIMRNQRALSFFLFAFSAFGFRKVVFP